MKTFTSASAGKYLKALDEEKAHLLAQEREVATYTLAIDEEPDIPEYNYQEVRDRVAEIDSCVRKIRHALHLFNATELLSESKMTIDEALIYLAQLNAEKRLLALLRDQREKERISNGWRSEIIEYRYANYDIARAAQDYARVSQEISDLQLEIDLVNQTRTFEVDV